MYAMTTPASNTEHQREKARCPNSVNMAPLPSPRDRASDTAARNSNPHRESMASCNFCLGVSVYNKAMADRRLPPRCDGLEIQTQRSQEYLEEVEQRAGKIRTDNFALYGIGLSIYSPQRMATNARLPVVRGLGVMVLKSDPDEFMRRMEERKRVQRELGQVGDDDDDYEEDDDDDDDDIVEDQGDDAGLMEKPPLGSGMPKAPRMPPLLPTMSFEEFVGKSVDNSKTMVRAMYNFWAKRLDGFGERYQESCRRIVAQMQKQIHQVPESIGWMKRKVKEIEDQVRRGGGGAGGGADGKL